MGGGQGGKLGREETHSGQGKGQEQNPKGRRVGSKVKEMLTRD